MMQRFSSLAGFAMLLFMALPLFPASEAVLAQHLHTTTGTQQRKNLNIPAKAQQYFIEAQKAAERHLYKEAIKLYGKAIKLFPRYQKALYERGHLHLHNQSYSESLEDLSMAIKLDSNDYDAWGMRGCTLYWLKRYDEAIKSFTEEFRLSPEASNGLYFRALCYMELGDTTKAHNDMLYGAVYLKGDVRDECENLIVRHNPALWLEFNNDAGYAEFLQGNYCKSAFHWSRVALQQPENAHARHNMTKSYIFCANDSSDFAIALEYCQDLIGKFPNDSAYTLRAGLYYSTKNYPAGINDCNQALELNARSVDAYMLRANLHFLNDSLPHNGFQDLRAAITLNSKSDGIWARGGNILFDVGLYDSAEVYYSKALEYNSNNYLHLKKRGQCRLKSGKPQDAIADFRNVITKIHQENDNKPEKRHTYHLAESYRLIANAKQVLKDSTAIEDFSRSLRIYPQARTFGERGSEYMSQQRYVEAIRDFDSVCTIARGTTNELQARLDAAECYYYLKEYTKALRYLKEPSGPKPIRSRMYYVRAYVQSELGNADAACSDFRQAAALGLKWAEEALKDYCSCEEEYEEADEG